MKNKYRIFIIALIVVAASAALIYWQSNKNTIIENRIDKVVTKKSGSLFSITYDSSFIDELNGNAFFYNVSLSPDTMLAKSQDVKNVFKVSIAEVAIKGANIIGLLTGTTLQAHSLQFINPIFEIENRNQQAQPYSKDDTLALYEKLLGKYNSIKADEIIVNNGSVKILNSYNNTLTTLKQIDINLANFKIDSTKDYENLVSYFVKGLEARVGSITGGPRLSPGYLLDQINYSATNRKMTVQNFRVFKNKEVVTNLKNLSIDGLETGIFLREQRIVANELKTAGGQVTIYRKKGNKLNALETDSTVFDKAKIRKVEIGKSRVVIINKDKPGDAPFVLNDVEFTATDIPEVDGTFTKSIAASNWLIRGSGIKSLTENKGYNINIGPYVLDKGRMFATVENFSIKPKLTEAAFVKSLKVQADYFQVEGHSLAIKNINFEEAFSKQSLLASEVSFRPSIKIYNDRTLP
ncbi:MAG: hypothetical protein ABIO05_02165, partial [Ferruginibacter sp.]